MKKDLSKSETEKGIKREGESRKQIKESFKKAKKKAILIGVVLLVLLLGGVLLFLALWGEQGGKIAEFPLMEKIDSPDTKNEEQDSQQYINDKYGYSLKIPANWSLVAEVGEEDLREREINGRHMEVGAGIILAKGEEINPEELESTPAVALTIFRSDSKINYQIAQWFGFGDSLVEVEEYVNEQEVEGKKYVEGSPGEEGYGWLVIYRNTDKNLYYVFNLNFASDNHNTIKEVRGIVDGFELR
jgi:hypothetical protein